MENIKNKLAKDHGDYTFDGVKYYLVQAAYLDGETSTAMAIKDSDTANQDNEVPAYRITWAIANPDAEDASEACDWDSPSAIKDLGERYDLTNRHII